MINFSAYSIALLLKTVLVSDKTNLFIVEATISSEMLSTQIISVERMN